MKKAARKILILFLVLLLICIGVRLLLRNTYTAYLPRGAAMEELDPAQLQVEITGAGVAGSAPAREKNGALRMTVRPTQPGPAYITVRNARGETLDERRLEVGRFLTVYDESTGGFTGDWVVLVAVTLFWMAVTVIMAGVYRQAKGPGFYSYDTLYAVGFGLFSCLTAILMLAVTFRHILTPYNYSMLSAYSAIAGASMSFVTVTAPLLVAFSLAMTVSNIELLRHERFRGRNVLGIGISAVMLAGLALLLYVDWGDFAGSEREWRVRNTLQNLCATGYAYFECMLLGAVVCGLRAARHVPELNAGHILILGCGFRKDGTLPPLLRGRVDRAIAFWKEQREKTGRTAILMPSGGQGPDECMAEAEAMRRYLLSQGIPEQYIRPEARSRNTYQNMAFSKELIGPRDAGEKVVFSTTNYHVFRSGVWANLAGLPAEGVGSRTKWWFWPNAFMRECVGLLQNRWKQELVLLVLLAALFGVLSMALT